MPELSDERINQLLSEAEGRLATTQQSSWSSGKENKTAVAVSASRDVAKPADVEGPPRQQSQQRLTVRDVRPTELKKERNDAGPAWFGIPKTDPNDKELKRDMQLLQMRGTALDPSRHYKKGSLKARVPKYAHVGRIVEGPADFYSGRLTRKERKKTLLDEIMAANKQSGKYKSKYEDIQSRKTSGKKAFYKKMVAQRRRRN